MARFSTRRFSTQQLRSALSVLVAGTLLGCASFEAPGMPPDLRCADASCGAVDAGPLMPSIDAGGGVEGLATGSDFTGASPETRASCYDGQDNDGDGAFDCGSPGCATLASCCVGATSLGCCGTPEVGASMSLGACAGSLDGCGALDGLVGFGTPSPTASDGRLFPNGDASHDSGIVLTRPLDAQRAIVVSGVLAVPFGDCPDGCFESVGLGLIATGTPGREDTLRPLAAVVASAARGELALVLAGETVGHLPLADALERRVELVLLPTGAVLLTVRAAVTGVELGRLTGRVVPSAVDLRLAIYGHNVNRSATSLPGSYAREVSASVALCDAPSRWLERSAISIGTGADTLGSSSAPSFAYGGGQTFVAFASEGALLFGRADGEDVARGFALLAANRRFAIAGQELSDPEVLYDPASGGTPAGYTVYFANRTTRSIWRMRLGLDGTPFEAPTEWLGPALDPTFLEAIDGPSVLRPASATSGPTFVLARIRTTTHETRIVRFTLASESDALTAPADWDAVTVRTTQSDFGAFDRDEVASPAAYRQNGSVQVAFAGRSGPRWAIGLMASDDPSLALWRRAPAPTILSGDGSGFDALSVRDPAVVARGTKVELLYAGSEGAIDTLGYARREATDHVTGGP